MFPKHVYKTSHSRGWDTDLKKENHFKRWYFTTVTLLVSLLFQHISAPRSVPAFTIFTVYQNFYAFLINLLARLWTQPTLLSAWCAAAIHHKKVSETEENEDKLYRSGMGKAEGKTIFPRSTGRTEEQYVRLSQSNADWRENVHFFNLLSIIVEHGAVQEGK